MPEIRSEDSLPHDSGLTGWFWLGGRDELEEGVWRWESNGELIDMSMFWAEGQPDNDQNENCLMSMTSGDFHDYFCIAALEGVVCEFD